MPPGDQPESGDDTDYYIYRRKYQTPQRPLSVAQQFHYILSWSTIRIGVPLILLMFLSIPIYLSIELNITLLIAFVTLPFGLYAINMLIVSVWRVARWLRRVIETYWNGQTPPHRDGLAEDINLLTDIYRHTFTEFNQVKWPIEVESREENAIFAVTNGTFGYITFILMGLLIAVIGDFGVAEGIRDSSISSSNVSFPAAIISVLLGGVFGLFTIGGAILSTSVWEFLAYVLILGIPSIFFAPSTMNLLILVETGLANLCATENPAETTKQTLKMVFVIFGLLFACLIIYASLFQIL